MLGVGEFFVAAMVAAVVNEFLGVGEVVLQGFPRVRYLAEEQAGAVRGNDASIYHYILSHFASQTFSVPSEAADITRSPSGVNEHQRT